MKDEQKTHDGRPAYEAPQALRLDGPHTGRGGNAQVCDAPGSSAEQICQTGIGAIVECLADGSSALACIDLGNQPTPN